MPHQVKTEVFIVRIWKEPRERAGVRTLWRGRVEHVASKAVRHIHQFSELVDFVKDKAGVTGNGADRS